MSSALPGLDCPLPLVTELPEDLRRIAGDVELLKVESAHLRALPAWVGELANLRSLAVGTDFDHCYAFTHESIREIPASGAWGAEGAKTARPHEHERSARGDEEADGA